MNRHRNTIIVTILILSGMLMLPAAAAAGTMLSGYGGPGAGDQAILGSTLVGGQGGGRSGGSTGSHSGGFTGSSSGSSSGRVQGQPGSETQAGGAGGVHAAKLSKVGRRGSNRAAAVGGASNRPTSAYSESVGSRPQAALSDAATSGSFGLNGSDLISILIVAVGLVLTGGLTRRLARTPS